MNSIVPLISDTAAPSISGAATLGCVYLGLSLAVIALGQSMHAGFRFITVDHLPAHQALPLALLYPLAGPARLIRHLRQEHRNDIAVRAANLAACKAAHPSNQRARVNAMAAHPAGKGQARALRLVRNANDAA